tara:strand:+ start:5465 stop:5857 length:393 start_codon:yes stop_codon:yes gene_type:complete
MNVIELAWKTGRKGQQTASKMFNSGHLVFIEQTEDNPLLYTMWSISPDGANTPHITQKYGQVQTSLLAMVEESGGLIHAVVIERDFKNPLSGQEVKLLDYTQDPITNRQLQVILKEEYPGWRLVVEDEQC